MLFSTGSSEQAADRAATEGVLTAFGFDWDGEKTYRMEKGSPAQVTETEAVKEWLQLVLRTQAGRYAIYPADFGASLYDLIGKRLPRGASLAELRRQLQASAAYLPEISSIGSVTWDGEKITCSVTLDRDGGEETEVIELEP